MNMSLSSEDAAAFYKFSLLSATAVLQGRYEAGGRVTGDDAIKCESEKE